MLFRSPELGREEAEVIEAIARIHARMKYALGTPSKWYGLLRRNTLARAIRGSNSIEGYLVSKDDAVAAVEGEDPIDAESATWREVMGYRNAMTFVMQVVRDPSFTFNEGVLRSLHFMMLQHELAKHPGNWRPGPIYVRDEVRDATVYESPPLEMVQPLIRELVSYICGRADQNHILVKGAMAHLNLVMIHPFSDGNGRMARCFQTLVLAMKVPDPVFSSIEEYLGRHTGDYYDILAETGKGSWNPGNETRPWIRFNLTAHYRQAAVALCRMKLISRLSDEIEREVAERGLPERSYMAMVDAAMGYRIRSVHYRNAADVSANLASRDLKALVDSGLLIASGEKRGRFYTASEGLRAIYRRIRESEFRKIPDPFAEGMSLEV
jgi:Fic family protein